MNALSRLFNRTDLELIFAVAGCVVVSVILGYMWWARSGSIAFSMVDAAVAIVWISDLTSWAASTYKRNSFDAILDLAFLTLVYALFRVLIICSPSHGWFSLILALLGAAVAFAQGRRLKKKTATIHQDHDPMPTMLERLQAATDAERLAEDAAPGP
jgi:hypothetical protein